METKNRTFQWIDLPNIKPNRLNPRLEFRKEGLDELADSLKNSGMVEPIVVRPRGESYEVVVGERRYRAAQQAGLDNVPAIVSEFSDTEVLELNLIENVHREDLTAIEKGKACLRLLEEFPETYPSRAAIARRMGLGEGAVNGWISVAIDLPEEAHQYIAPETAQGRVPEGKVDWRTAQRAARQIEEPERRVEAIRELAGSGVRGVRAREYVSRIARESDRPVQEVIKEVSEEPAELPFRSNHVDMILEGVKTQTSRKGIPDPRVRSGAVVYANMYEPRVATLRVREIERKRLGEFTEADAAAEGGYTLSEFREVWRDIHPEGWNESTSVYVIKFDLEKR